MKAVYRKSFWKSSIPYNFLVPTILSVALLLLNIKCVLNWDYTNWIAALIFFLIIPAPIYWFGVIKQSYYVVITDNSIIVKNYFISLLNKEYKYCEINRCLIGQTPYGMQYMQYLTMQSSRWSCFYGLELVCKEDLISIQGTLLQNDIIVVNQKN